MKSSFWSRVAVIHTALALTAVAGANAQAEARFSVEARGGGAMGSYELASADASWGQRPAVAAALHYAVTPRWSAYAGYSLASFGCSGGFCDDAEIHYVSRGWDAGAQLGGAQGIWVRAGGSLHSLDVPLSVTGSPRIRSGRSPGVHAAGGYGFRVHPRLTISPSLRYTRYSATFADHPAGDRVDYLVADVGLSVTF